MTSDRNPTDELNQALNEKRMDGAEKTTLEVISRALGLPQEVIYRVIYAYESLKNVTWQGDTGYDDWQDLIEDDEVRQAIRLHMEAGARRVMLRKAIDEKTGIGVATNKLIAPEDAVKICDGCPVRLECVADSLYTYNECYRNRLSLVTVVPLRMYKGKVDVEAAQPQGRYTLPLETFSAKRY